MKYIFVTKSGMAIGGINIGKKSQHYFHHVTAINTDNSGLLASDTFCEIFACNDAQNVNYDCGRNERCLNIDLTWQHDLTLGEILKYVDVKKFSTKKSNNNNNKNNNSSKLDSKWQRYSSNSGCLCKMICFGNQ